jgi:hypothetical protein
LADITVAAVGRVPKFVLIPGAGGHAAYWNRLIPELETRGQGAIAVDIEENDPAMDLDGFVAAVEAAMGDDADVILVAQSLGGFTAPMIRKPARMIVLLNAMIPRSGESPNEWWGNTGSGAARREADLAAGRDPVSMSIGISSMTFPTTPGRSCYPLTHASRLPRRWRSPATSRAGRQFQPRC